MNPEVFCHALAGTADAGSDRGGIIDRALADIDRPDVPVAPLVEAFRRFVPKVLHPYPGVLDALRALADRVPLGLVTDGWAPGQRAKVAALGLRGMFAVEVYSDELGREHRKPDPLPFVTALAGLSLRPSQAVFVGDRPDKDVRGAQAVGLPAIRVRSGEYAGVPGDAAGVPEYDTVVEAIDALLERTAPTAASRSAR